MTLANKVQQFITDSDTAHAIVHGDENTTVQTEGGPVRSFAKVLKDISAFIQSGIGAISRTIHDKMRERVSVLDFMTDAQRADVALAAPVLDHTSAFNDFIANLQATRRAGDVPAGSYRLTGTVDILAGVSIAFSPKAKIQFAGVATPIFRVRNGVTCRGNGAPIVITNAAWDGDAVLIDGEDKFKADTNTRVNGFHITGQNLDKGTGLRLQALGPGHCISFVHIDGFSYTNIRDAEVLDAGSSGSSDPGTWHWITSNIIAGSTFYFTKTGRTLNALTSTPAEIAGNEFPGGHWQPGTGTPLRITGASFNFMDAFIWDWNIVENGSPIIMEGGAAWNNIRTNIDASQVSGGANNKLFDMGGSETGQRIFLNDVSFFGLTLFGRSGVSGLYASRYLPDTSGSAVFWSKNSGGKYSFGVGSNPYAGTEAYNVDDAARITVGGGANGTQSAFRVNGAPAKSVAAFRIGTDGYAGNLFENSAGNQVGYISIGTSATTYSTSSDYRLKRDIRPLEGSGAFIDALKPSRWAWIIDGTPGAGFIAHQLQETSPSSVVGVKDQVDADGNPVFQAVEYGSAEVMANVVAEMQSMRARLAALERK